MASEWPRSGFLTCAARHGEGDAHWEVRGIDVAAIAFVRRADGRHELQPCGLHDLDDDVAASLDMLLACGNDAPPAELGGPDAFIDTLRAGDYRGALALVEPTLGLDREGAPSSVSFRILAAGVGAGYVLARGADGELEPQHNTTGPSDGARQRVSFEEGGVRIEHYQRFGMANPADFLGRYAPNKPAPLGWIRVSYWLGVDGQSRAHVGCSYLPSCWFYRDWMRVYRRDMLLATRDEIECVVFPEHERASGTTWAAIDTATGQVHAAG
jgi:hypothetical protein